MAYNFKENIKKASISDNYLETLEEWVFVAKEELNEPTGQCICSKIGLKVLNYYYNIENNKCISVGNACKKKFNFEVKTNCNNIVRIINYIKGYCEINDMNEFCVSNEKKIKKILKKQIKKNINNMNIYDIWEYYKDLIRFRKLKHIFERYLEKCVTNKIKNYYLSQQYINDDVDIIYNYLDKMEKLIGHKKNKLKESKYNIERKIQKERFFRNINIIILNKLSEIEREENERVKRQMELENRKKIEENERVKRQIELENRKKIEENERVKRQIELENRKKIEENERVKLCGYRIGGEFMKNVYKISKYNNITTRHIFYKNIGKNVSFILNSITKRKNNDCNLLMFNKTYKSIINKDVVLRGDEIGLSVKTKNKKLMFIRFFTIR